MKKLFTLFLSISIAFSTLAQQKTIQERLGYPQNTKLLIIHADDLGVSHSENIASIHALEKGSVSSASIMVPCPWFPEIAAYAKANPNADLGLHLTLTSEWKLYKWRPVAPHSDVKSLLDEQGYMNETVEGFLSTATPEDVEKELRSQIERAREFGIDPTHLDAHMGAAFSTEKFLEILIKLSREYKIPAMISKDFSRVLNIDYTKMVSDRDIVVDRIIIASSRDYKSGMEAFYQQQIKSLQPGLSVLLLHAAYDNDEMKAVTMGHEDYGSKWRQIDFNFFTSETCKKLLVEQNVKVITWKEIRDKIVRAP